MMNSSLSSTLATTLTTGVAGSGRVAVERVTTTGDGRVTTDGQQRRTTG